MEEEEVGRTWKSVRIIVVSSSPQITPPMSQALVAANCSFAIFLTPLGFIKNQKSERSTKEREREQRQRELRTDRLTKKRDVTCNMWP